MNVVVEPESFMCSELAIDVYIIVPYISMGGGVILEY